MIPVSDEYKRQLIAGNRNYLIKVNITLMDNPDPALRTRLELDNEDIWDGGITIDEAISSSDTFDIGSAIVSSATVVINNISESFSEYDFLDARLTIYLGVEGDLDQYDEQIYYRKGFYVVDETSYNGSLITLNCLDNMTWFDVPYKDVGISTDVNLTAGQFVSAICSHVGVSLATAEFPRHLLDIRRNSLKALAKGNYNCREVLEYVAQKCCCYCKINTAGELVLDWYDKSEIISLTDYDGGTYNTNTTPYSDGVALDGGQWYYDGTTYVWTGGDDAEGGTFQSLQNRAWLSNNFEMNVSTEDIVITGARVVCNNGSDEEKYDVTEVNPDVEETHPRYTLRIENNPLILYTEAYNICGRIMREVEGLPIRAFNSRSLSDFSYETGDMVTIVDFRGHVYYTWITHFTFTTNNSESFSCGAQSVKKRSESRHSKTIAEAGIIAESTLTDYDKAVKAMDELAQNAIGFNEYVYGSGSSKIMYRYDGAQSSPSGANPKFPNANNVFKITGDGVFVARRANGDIAADGTCTYSNGYDANSGTAILNLIYAQGLNANWITAGTINTNLLNVSGVITAINNEGSTTISGNKITTGSMNANRIGAGTIDASVISVTHLNASNITTGTMSANKVRSGSIESDNYSYTQGSGYSNAGTIIGLEQGVIRTPSFYIGTNGNAHFKGELFSTSGEIAGWTLNTNGFTNGSDAWVKPTEISCGKHGATLVKMLGKTSGNDGYLSVEVNASDDYIHVRYDGITKKNNGVTQYATFSSSDRRFKKNIEDLSLDESLDIISKVTPRKFEFKSEAGTRYGFIAQELREVIDDDCAVEYGEEYRAIHYEDFIAPLCRVVKEQQKEIDLLKQEVAELKARIN